MNSQLIGEIKERLDTAKNIVIASHVRPDGDAIGALLGLGLALRDAGKSVQMILADGVPSSFKYLEGSELIKKEAMGEHDTFITVDCADFKRTGKIFENFGQPDINIDHHKTNEKFGKLNLIEADEVATSAILTTHLSAWGLKITKPIAAALLAGIITDTLGFRTSNTTPNALRQAATLMETGVDMSDIYMRALVKKTYPAVRYWGAGLSSLESMNGIVCATLRMNDRNLSGYLANDDADLIDLITSIEGFRVGMVFVEQPGNNIKISWRALVPGIDVSAIAKFFGGGGHFDKAGADLVGDFEKVKSMVLAKTYETLAP